MGKNFNPVDAHRELIMLLLSAVAKADCGQVRLNGQKS